MIKKTFYSLLFLVLLSTNLYSAGSDSTSKVKSDYTQAVTLIKAAKTVSYTHLTLPTIYSV